MKMCSPQNSSDDWLEQTVRISDLESYSNLNVCKSINKSSNARMKETLREHMAKGVEINLQKRPTSVVKKDLRLKNYNKCCVRNPQHHICSDDNRPFYPPSSASDDYAESRKSLSCDCRKRDKRCPLRIMELAAPTKRHCLETWKAKSHILSSEMIERLKMNLMGQTPVVEVSDAINCFCYNRKQESRKLKSCCPANPDTAIFSVLFARKLKRLLLPPCCICGFSPELQKLCDVVECELSNFNVRSEQYRLNQKTASCIRKDVAKRITLWIMTVLEETTENMEQEEFKGDGLQKQRAKKTDRLITLVLMRNMLKNYMTYQRQDLEEQEGHIWKIIDDTFDNAMTIIEEKHRNSFTNEIVNSTGETFVQADSDTYTTVISSGIKTVTNASTGSDTQIRTDPKDGTDEVAKGSQDKLAVKEISSFTNLRDMSLNNTNDTIKDVGDEDNNQEDVSNIGEDTIATIDESNYKDPAKGPADLDPRIVHFTSDLDRNLGDVGEFRSSLKDTLNNLENLFTFKDSNFLDNMIFLPPNLDLLTPTDEVWPDDKTYPEVKIRRSICKLGYQEMMSEVNEINFNARETFESSVDLYLNDLESKSSPLDTSLRMDVSDKNELMKSPYYFGKKFGEDPSKYGSKMPGQSISSLKSLAQLNDTDDLSVYFDGEVSSKFNTVIDLSRDVKFTQTSVPTVRGANESTSTPSVLMKEFFGDIHIIKNMPKFNYRVQDGEAPPWGKCQCGCGEQQENTVSSIEFSLPTEKEAKCRSWCQSIVDGFSDCDDWRQWLEDTCKKAATLSAKTGDSNKHGPLMTSEIQKTKAQFCQCVNHGTKHWLNFKQTTKNNLHQHVKEYKNHEKAEKKAHNERIANDNFSRLVRLMDGIDEMSSLIHDEVVSTEYCVICKRPRVSRQKLKSQRTTLHH